MAMLRTSSQLSLGSTEAATNIPRLAGGSWSRDTRMMPVPPQEPSDSTSFSPRQRTGATGATGHRQAGGVHAVPALLLPPHPETSGSGSGGSTPRLAKLAANHFLSAGSVAIDTRGNDKAGANNAWERPVYSLLTLQPEVVEVVLSFLDLVSLCRSAQVCRRLRDIIAASGPCRIHWHLGCPCLGGGMRMAGTLKGGRGERGWGGGNELQSEWAAVVT